MAYREGEYGRTEALFEESLTLARREDDPRSIANALNGLGNVANERGEYALAATRYQEALDLFRATGAPERDGALGSRSVRRRARHIPGDRRRLARTGPAQRPAGRAAAAATAGRDIALLLKCSSNSRCSIRTKNW